MSVDRGLVDWVAEAMTPVGAVTWRPMMVAATLYCDGAVFAIVDGDELWLKADKKSDALWDAAGPARFTFTGKDGKAGSMNDRRAPADCHDDAEALREWAGHAVAAGRRARK